MKNILFPAPKAFILFILLIFSATFNAIAQLPNTTQEPIPHPFWSQVRFGGSIGLAFGNGYFNGQLSPSAIYDFNPLLSSGLSLTGAYAKQNEFSATSLGGSVIGMLRPIREIQLSAEYQQLNINRRLALDGSNVSDRYWVPALFLGVGYNTGPVVTGVRYDVLHGDKSFYSSAFLPFVSIYF